MQEKAKATGFHSQLCSKIFLQTLKSYFFPIVITVCLSSVTQQFTQFLEEKVCVEEFIVCHYVY